MRSLRHMPNNDLESRISKLENKAFFWDVASTIVAVIAGVGLIKLLPNAVLWIFLGAVVVGGILYLTWEWVRPILWNGLLVLLGLTILMTFMIISSLNQYHQAHSDEHWSFSTWSFVQN